MLTFNLTTPQRNIWSLQKYYENTSIANVCGSVIYNVNYDYNTLNNAVNAVIASQEALRLRIGVNKGNVEQYSVTAEHEDFLYLRFQNADELRLHSLEIAHTPMDLIDQKLYHIEIICLNGKNGILVCLNHLIADAWSVAILARMVEQCCISFVDKQDYRYSSFVESECRYLSSMRYIKDKEFWENTFRNKVKVCSIKPETTPVVIPTADKYTFGIGRELSGKIKAYCEGNMLSPAVLFESALFIYLSKLNPECKELIIGNAILNRSTINEKSTVGMFISTIPLKISVSQDMTISELSNRITDTHTKVFRHQKYPYSQIAEYVRQKHGMDSLYQVMFSYQNAKTEINAETEWYSNGYSEVPFVLHVDDRDSTSEYTLTVDYQTEIFKQEEIEYVCKRLLFIITQIIATPALPLAEINIIPSEEYQKLIYDFNDTAVEYPREKCVHELFTEQVKRTPDKTALVFEDKLFTYKQLDEMSNSLAHYLREEMGIRQNDIVPIIAKRSWHIIVAMLGILKAGGAYMPVDPTYPVDRILYMMSDARSGFALTYGFKNSEVCCKDLEDFNYSRNIEPIRSINRINDLCYLVYTSGSTGMPKGVKITHANVANYVDDNHNNVVHKIIKVGHKGIVSVTNIVFDIFVTESLLPLTNGLTIYLANNEEVSSQHNLAQLIMRSDKIDVLQTTPTKMRSYILNKENLKYLQSLKTIILGGEALTSDLASELKACTDAEIFNIYGPAETTVWTTNAAVNPVDITIGKPIANTQIYILDHNRKPLPIGVAGELCISGDSVGKGYLNNPELTAEKFIPDPFREGQTMYCTGDLARWRTDGEIEYLGRIDTQVKIRGLRIELGEIESMMSSFQGISLCAVTDKRDEKNRQYLVGYYTADTQIDEKALRKHLSAKLPKYMIPNYFVRLDAMPMTASGKTDRKNLPLPDFSKGKGVFVAPRNETEQMLCTLMSELLNIENIGITDNFFDLGGDSFGAMSFIADAHNAGIEISLQDLYDHPTVESLLYEQKELLVYSAEKFAKYDKILHKAIHEKDSLCRRTLGNVLLTGATGFLGAHVLDALMKEEAGTVYCLVRSIAKFKDMLHYYFDKLYDDNERIIPVLGDITEENLADNLPNKVETIIHTAANVSHYGTYSKFQKTNVDGTKNIIRYAKSIHARMVHISTISVSGNAFADTFTINRTENEINFDESCLYVGQSLENFYIRSKFDAECAVLDAILDGLDAIIIRIGNLTNRTGDYKFQLNYEQNAFLTRVCAGLKLGVLPDNLLSLYAEFSPINDTADGIVRIAEHTNQQIIFHLYSNKPVYFTRLIEILCELGIHMNVISGLKFREILEKMNRDDRTKPLYIAFQNDMDYNGNLLYDSNIHIFNDTTINFLRKTGFEWSEIDLDYIKGYIEYFREIGLLEV